MKISRNVSLALMLGTLLAACGGGGTTTTSDANINTDTTSTGSASSGTNTGSTVTTVTTPAATGTAPAINAPDGARLLASQCFQCHGMNGVSATGIESIAGDSAADLIEEMLEMKYSTKIDIMHYQAKGYSEAEIRSMAQYLSALPKDPNGGND
ncbi:MAG: c-type cytochrome [Candidatus Thiothrix sulfatifontis]|nr:MAG: c-type cytochrome [Candidatus Thiothrix sulfatifontis]